MTRKVGEEGETEGEGIAAGLCCTSMNQQQLVIFMCLVKNLCLCGVETIHTVQKQ